MSFPKVPGWSTVSDENSKCRSVYTAMPDITHSPFHFGGGFGSELQKSILLMKDPVYGLSGYDPSMWLWTWQCAPKYCLIFFAVSKRIRESFRLNI